MRILSFVAAGVLLSACAGSGHVTQVTPPAGSSPSGTGRAPAGTTIVGKGQTLWVGTASAVYAYVKKVSGSAPDPLPVVSFQQTGYDTTIAPDNTVYETTTDGVLIYGPWERGTAQPEEILTKGTRATLVGDGIDTAAITASSSSGGTHCETVTVYTYAYGAGSRPVPFRTLTAPFPCTTYSSRGLYNDVMIATDGAGRIYVFHDGEVHVFAAGASGSAQPVRIVSTPTALPVAFTVGLDGTISVLWRDAVGEVTTISQWGPTDDGPAASRTVGARLANGSSASAIAVDAHGNLYAAVNETNGSSVVYTVAPGGTTPVRQLVDPVPVGQAINSLAIGP
jgi:hypothetical protein